MTFSRLSWRLLSMLLVAAFLVSCQRPAKPDTRVEEMYFPTDGAVGFDILPAGSSAGAQGWSATYTDRDGKTTKFQIELGPATGSSDKSPAVSSGQGKFLAETGSDPIPLLESLKKTLQARRMPRNVQKVDVLPFDYVVVGENQSRSPNGLSGNPKGNWTSMKISFAKGKGEVFLNVNPVIHKAEFSIKDPGEGEFVLAELAKVL
ncbi:MAG: hypothetical protein LAN83_15335 [Acidobacteriia bacterium]|nr:hypothetical protein [Terriglobia bacterium]